MVQQLAEQPVFWTDQLREPNSWMNEKKKERKNALVVAEQPHSRVVCDGWTATFKGWVWWLKSHIKWLCVLSVVAESHIKWLCVVAEQPHSRVECGGWTAQRSKEGISGRTTPCAPVLLLESQAHRSKWWHLGKLLLLWHVKNVAQRSRGKALEMACG